MAEISEPPSTLPQNLESSFLQAAQTWKKLLPFLLILPGIAALGFSFLADFLGFGGLPGFGARQMSMAISGLAILLAGIILLLPANRRWPLEWMLIGTATLAVALAADLVVLNTGPSQTIHKIVVMTAVAFSVIVGMFGTGILAPSAFHDRWRAALAAEWVQAARILGIIVQLVLLVLVIKEFSLETEVFSHNIMLLTFNGFLIHLLLPSRYRLFFFLLISGAGILGVFGLVNGTWLIGIGLALIGIAHLPVRFSYRIVLILVAALTLVAFRLAWFESPWSSAIWPILGSMFMFRLIVFLYDLKHQKEPFNFTQTLAYFFLLPNVVFPLFPVIDYSNFKRTYFKGETSQIYQTGVSWIFRGAYQLILYRFVSYYLLIAPEDVTNQVDLVRYLVSNVLLYLRVSGQFHIVIGMLHLFGFNLPETNNNYFLASSFTDYWRRINIYWKDFMLKVFYYPIYFQLSSLGSTARLALATLLVFIMTWLLHAYQWFWLRGTFLLTPQDMLYWAILALLVVANSLYEVRAGRKRTLGKKALSWRELGSRSLRTLGTFAMVCVIWSLWTSVSLKEWLALWSIPWFKVGDVTTLLPLVLVFGIVRGTLWKRGGDGSPDRAIWQIPAFLKTSLITGLSIAFVFLAGNPSIYTHLDERIQSVIQDLRTTRLNAQDADLLERGYYEDLIGVDRFNSQLWEIYMKRPQNRPDIFKTEAGRFTNDFLSGELVPNSSTVFFEKTFSINQWGMRDRDYDLAKPAGTYRVALIGASIPMGWGVGDGETFEAFLEDRLNLENDQSTYESYEILNFSVEGYNVLQNLYTLENKAFTFEPDAVFFIAHPKDGERVMVDLLRQIKNETYIPFEFIRGIIEEEAISPQSAEITAKRSLRQHDEEMVLWAYRQMVEQSRERNALPVFILLPRIVGIDEPREAARQIELAEQAGFVVLDLTDVYEGQDVDDLLLASWDWHPNVDGHNLIAKYLHTALKAHGTEIPLELPAP
jgi:hypothetical protein